MNLCGHKIQDKAPGCNNHDIPTIARAGNKTSLESLTVMIYLEKVMDELVCVVEIDHREVCE